MSNPCSFPAIQLLRLRRRIAETPTIPIHEQARLVKEIDEMRHDHHETTSCTCWQNAILGHPNPAGLHPSRKVPRPAPVEVSNVRRSSR